MPFASAVPLRGTGQRQCYDLSTSNLTTVLHKTNLTLLQHCTSRWGMCYSAFHFLLAHDQSSTRRTNILRYQVTVLHCSPTICETVVCDVVCVSQSSQRVGCWKVGEAQGAGDFDVWVSVGPHLQTSFGRRQQVQSCKFCHFHLSVFLPSMPMRLAAARMHLRQQNAS
jgi:hypothetical protein